MTTDKVPVIKLEPSDHEPHVEAWAIIAGDVAGRSMPRYVEKSWGYELIYKNDEQYCCKLLHFDEGATSMHFHVIKHETLVVTKGLLTVEYIINKETKCVKIPKGCALVVCPGFPHRLMALDGEVELMEASTEDYADDSVRIN